MSKGVNKNEKYSNRSKEPNMRGGKNGKYSNKSGRRSTAQSKSDYTANGNSSNCHNDAVNSRINDPKWYVYNDVVGKSVGNLYFSTPLGQPVMPRHLSTQRWDGKFPGIMRFTWVPTPGFAFGASPDSPVNVAAQSIYSHVRHANSGSKNYEKTDLMMYLLALDSLYTHYAQAMRILGLARAYSLTNRYFPRACINDLGWDFEDVVANQARLQSSLSVIAHALGSLAAPAGMTYYTRHLWLASHVWTDDESAKSQSYVFWTPYLLEWKGRQEQTGTALNIVDLHNNDTVKFTVDSWTSTMLEAIQTLLADEDVGVISGDIKKAFPELMVLGVPSPDYVLYPEYSPNMVYQIQNLNVVGVLREDQFEAYVSQMNGQLTCNPGFYFPVGIGYVGGYFNMRKDDPTWEDTVDASRFSMVQPDAPISVDTGNLCYYSTSGSEVCTDVTVFDDPEDPTSKISLGDMQENTSLSGGSLLSFAHRMSALVNFDWHPYYYCMESGTNPPSNTIVALIGDVDNVTTISKDWLAQVNRIALTTQFMVPAMGTFNPGTPNF